MWLVFLLLIFIVGIIFSSVELSLYSIDITEKSANFKLILSLKLFYVFKILFIKCDRFGMKIFYKKILYNVFFSRQEIKAFNKDILEMLKKLNAKVKKASFTLKIGLLDIALTNIVIVLISSFFPIFVKKQIHKKNLHYIILPCYNNLLVNFKGEISISLRLITLIKYYFKNIKQEITHNKNKNYGVKEIV